MSNYIRRFWKARAGTNLNKFTKSSETASSVILENAPDAITEAGTPFTADAMQNIENGIENGYKEIFSALGAGVKNYRGICSDFSGNLYTTVQGGDIYKSTDGGASFVALGQTARAWFGICSDPSGHLFAVVYSGDIYKSTDGGASFVALGQTARAWDAICSDFSGNLYAGDFGGDIYKSTDGGASFIALNQPALSWAGISVGATGALFAVVNAGGIYKSEYMYIAPSSCASASVTTADVTITENRDGTLILSGALTGNRVVYLPAAVWKKTIICDCTGAYSVRVLATGQSTGGVYLAPGDAADVYCDGTSANIIKMTRSNRYINLFISTGTVSASSGAAYQNLPELPEIVDILGEYTPATAIFTPKNTGWYRLSGIILITGSGLAGRYGISATRTGKPRAEYADTLAASATSEMFAFNIHFYAVAGDEVDVQYFAQTGTGLNMTAGTRIMISPAI